MNPMSRLPTCSSMWDLLEKPLPSDILESLTSRSIPNSRGVKGAYVLVPYGTAKSLAAYPARMMNYDGVERRILDRNGSTRAHVNAEGYIIPDDQYLNQCREKCLSTFGSDEYVAISAWDGDLNSGGRWLDTYEPSLPEDTDFKVLGLNMVMSSEQYPDTVCLRVSP